MSQWPTTEDPVTQRSIAQLEPLPSSLLDEPLDYIFADHFRQRSLCTVLRSFAQSRCARRASAGKVLKFLAHDLRLHHQDEEADLFPALRKRAEPEDGLTPILARLSEDHLQAEPLIEGIVAALSVKRPLDPIAIRTATAKNMCAYVARERRHLSIENGIVLVLARKRLKNADLAAMTVAMKARRLGAC